MPITADKAPSTLSGKAKRIYVAAWNAAYDGTCKDREDRDACSSKIAWSAVKSKYKKEGDKWVPKSDIADDALAQFSMYIDKAVYNKETQELRWHCVASDVDEDSYTDNMTLELFERFIERIQSGEAPPEKYCTEYWRGGEPYISVSHYSDQNGKGVPGDTECTYVDGEKLKAKGTFHKTPLGLKCFDAINQDKFTKVKSDNPELNNPVRISIAFLDYKHRHKSNGEIFERKSIDDICPWCILEALTQEKDGKEYLDGHLIHYALTRVPVNKRTQMEVEMAVTRKEDAESIVGDLAEELEQEEKQFRSEALVTMSEGDEEVPEVEETETRSDAEEDEEMDEEEKKKKKDDEKEEKAEHVLDKVFSAYRSIFDQVSNSALPYEEKLQTLQPLMEELANVTRASLQGITPEEAKQASEVEALRSEMNEKLGDITNQLQLLSQMLQEKSTVKDTTVPEPRSIQPAPVYTPVIPAQQVKAGTLKDTIRKSVGL